MPEAAAVAEDQFRDIGLPAATLAANCLTSCAAMAARDANLTRDGRASAARVLRPVRTTCSAKPPGPAAIRRRPIT